MVNGVGKEAKSSAGQWIIRSFRNNDRMHEGSIYVDQAIKVLCAMIACKGDSNAARLRRSWSWSVELIDRH